MNRNYVLLLSGYLFSAMGDWIYKLALPLLIYQLTHSAMDMALTFCLAYLPYVLFSPLGGLLADRLPQQRILFVGDLLSALTAGLLAGHRPVADPVWPRS